MPPRLFCGGPCGRTVPGSADSFWRNDRGPIQASIPVIQEIARDPEGYLSGVPTVEVVFIYRLWKGVGYRPGMYQNLGCALWRYLGVPMNTNLSFRKESIQRSSSESKGMRHSLAGLPLDQGLRQTCEQRQPSLTTTLTTIG